MSKKALSAMVQTMNIASAAVATGLLLYLAGQFFGAGAGLSPARFFRLYQGEAGLFLLFSLLTLSGLLLFWLIRKLPE